MDGTGRPQPAHAAPDTGLSPWWRRALVLAAVLLIAAVTAVTAVVVHRGPGGATRADAGRPTGAPASATSSTGGALVTPSSSAGAAPATSKVPTATSTAGPSSASPKATVPPTPRPTSLPSLRPPVAKPPSVPATSSKKGVAAWAFNGASRALDQSGASWYYTWSTSHHGIASPPGVDFVPMIWGPDSATDNGIARARSAGKYLLGFNEPDLGSQSNMTVGRALDLWPRLMATGQVIGSPAVARGGDTPGGWLDQFVSGATSRGYRVDFIALHWYGSDFITTNAVRQLKSYLDRVYRRYHKPIWLTEYALISFNDGTHFPTESQQAAFVTASTSMLRGLSYLQRYAWFALPASDRGPSSGLYTSGPTATEAGRAFEQAG